ncbi:MAG: hypothetical protein KF859_11425 [Phycisphaeraceae bacterium]|nr:hypothetical protein [Phycisphaeraceae bacterium]
MCGTGREGLVQRSRRKNPCTALPRVLLRDRSESRGVARAVWIEPGQGPRTECAWACKRAEDAPQARGRPVKNGAGRGGTRRFHEFLQRGCEHNVPRGRSPRTSVAHRACARA